MITRMIKTSELFDTHEDAYDTASWYGVLKILKEIAEHADTLDLLVKNTPGKFITELCVTVESSPHGLDEQLQTWLHNNTKNNSINRFKEVEQNRLYHLTRLGIYTSGDINPSLSCAIDIFNDSDWYKELSKNTQFRDQLEIIEELILYYRDRTIQKVGEAYESDIVIMSLYQDLKFYVGHYSTSTI